MSDFVPAIEELASMPDAEELFLRLASLPHCLFLDSARPDPRLGRYSFLAADPFDYFEGAVEDGDCLVAWTRRMAWLRAATVAGLPPFQGGAAGLLAYDLGRQIETLPSPRADEFRLPALAIGLYDVVIALDQIEHRGWIVSQGLPEVEPGRRRRRAELRLREAKGWLSGSASSRCHGSAPIIPANELASQYPMSNAEPLTSDFSEREYLQTVRRAIDYIEAGDIFQVNLAQRLLYPARDDSVSLYQRLRRCNPAPFAGYFDLGDFQINRPDFQPDGSRG